MSAVNYPRVAEALKVIAHMHRLKIIEILKGKELSVSDIQSRLKLKQSVVSQHLNKMKSKGILHSRRCANVVYYSILNKEVLKIISCLKNCQNS